MTNLVPHPSVAERRMLVHAVPTGTVVGIDYVSGESPDAAGVESSSCGP